MYLFMLFSIRRPNLIVFYFSVMPKRATQSHLQPEQDTVTHADILAVMHGYAQQNEQRFQSLEQHAQHVDNTLDYLVKTVSDIRQDKIAFSDLYKKTRSPSRSSRTKN